MQSLFVVNNNIIDKMAQETKQCTNAELDAVDDFCDFVKSVNKDAKEYCEKHEKQDQEIYFQKRFKKKYRFDWQKDALNYHASVKSHVQKERDLQVNLQKSKSNGSAQGLVEPTKAFQAEMGVLDDGRAILGGSRRGMRSGIGVGADENSRSATAHNKH